MQITTVLTNAQPRVVNKRDGSGSFTLFELFDHEGNAWVVKKDVFDGSQYLIGQTVDMIVRVEQNGQWTNRFADIVSPSQNAVPASNAAIMAMQAAQQANRVQPVITQQPMVPNTIGGMGQPIWQPGQPTGPTQKDQEIHRQTAAKVAAQISQTPQDFWSNVQDLATYFDTGRVPTGFTSQQTNPSPMAEVAATSGYQYGDQDVPF